MGDFTETHYLNEQMKSKDLGDHDTSVHKTGARESGMAEDPPDKHTPGDSDPESRAPGWLPTATGSLSWSLSPCMQVGVTVTFSVSWTKTSTQALSFALVLQIKRRGIPPKSYVYCHPRGRVPLQTKLLLPSMIESVIQHFCAFYLKLRSPYYITILSNITFI